MNFCIPFFKEIKIIKTSVGTLFLFYVGLLEIEWNRKIDYEKNDNVSLPLHYNLLKLKAFYKCFSYSVNKIRLIYFYHWINQKYIFISLFVFLDNFRQGQPMENGLRGVCHEIFDLHFFPWLEPIWAPDKQAKVFSNSVSISQRYSTF